MAACAAAARRAWRRSGVPAAALPLARGLPRQVRAGPRHLRQGPGPSWARPRETKRTSALTLESAPFVPLGNPAAPLLLHRDKGRGKRGWGALARGRGCNWVDRFNPQHRQLTVLEWTVNIVAAFLYAVASYLTGDFE